MENAQTFFFAVMLFSSSVISGQVQVSKEPLHKKAIENEYIRLLDVWIPPGDTSLYHIHSTPSVFVYLSNTSICSQVKDKGWVKDSSVAGTAWFRSFSPDTLIHRVSNCDSVPFHVNDIELLSSYDTNSRRKPLPFDILFENEKVIAYRLNHASLNKQIIENRGPLVFELVSGNAVLLDDRKTKRSKRLNKGQHVYMKPGASFHLTTSKTGEIDMVLFEIK